MHPTANSSRPLRYLHLGDTHFIHRAAMRTVDAPAGVHAVVEIDVNDDNINGVGGLQGGMMATLVDCVSGQAVAAHAATGSTYSTRDLNIHYLAALRVGPARALATTRRASRTSVVVQVDVVDAGHDDLLCAVATVAFAVRPMR